MDKNTLSYLDFVNMPVPKHFVTKKFNIYSKSNYDLLGVIRWKNEWRKYCFFPRFDTIYDSKCLLEIVEFIKKLMDERK